MTSDVLQEIRRLRLVPLVVMDDAASAVPLARALLDGGLPCAEIAFRTAAAGDAIRAVADACPDVVLGAGTVLSPSQADEARRAGARFIVSPGFNERVVRWCIERDLPVFPGVCTPTEIEAALGCGLSVLKFFPAEPMGGLPLLRAIAAPYAGVEFIPTGGITAANVATWLGFDRVVACGGSWMAPRTWIDAGEFERIRDEAARTVAAVRALSTKE